MTEKASVHPNPHDSEWFQHSRAEDAPQAAHGELHPVVITLSLAGMFIFVFAISLALVWYFNVEAQQIAADAKEIDTGEAAAAQRAQAKASLEDYAWVDKEAGLAEIPIESAMNYVRNAYHDNPDR